MVHVSRGKKDCPSHVDSLREEPLTLSLFLSPLLFRITTGSGISQLAQKKRTSVEIIGLPFGPKRARRSKIASRI